MGAVIEINNLSFAYEDVTEQLKNINLTVNEGEIVVLTGPSGGGKSTLTRVINGLVPYFYEGTLTGEVLLMGKNLKDIPSWERGRYIGKHNRHFPFRTYHIAHKGLHLLNGVRIRRFRLLAELCYNVAGGVMFNVRLYDSGGKGVHHCGSVIS